MLRVRRGRRSGVFDEGPAEIYFGSCDSLLFSKRLLILSKLSLLFLRRRAPVPDATDLSAALATAWLPVEDVAQEDIDCSDDFDSSEEADFMNRRDCVRCESFFCSRFSSSFCKRVDRRAARRAVESELGVFKSEEDVATAVSDLEDWPFNGTIRGFSLFEPSYNARAESNEPTPSIVLDVVVSMSEISKLKLVLLFGVSDTDRFENDVGADSLERGLIAILLSSARGSNEFACRLW